MEMISDGLLIATAMTAGLYCLVLSRRLRRLTESGNSIGPQIEALDRALEGTRAALTETREGVSELRGSTKAAIAQLTRETARGGDMAEMIERGIDEAKKTMQRLYEAADRIEAHENRSGKANGAGAGAPDGSAADPGDGPGIGWTGVSAEPAGPSGGGDSTAGREVAVPEGRLVEPGPEPEPELEAVSVAPAETTSERGGSILKADRVVL